MNQKKVLKIFAMVLIICIFFSTISFAEEPSTWAKSYVDGLKSQEVLDDSFYRDYTSNINRQDFAYLSISLYESLTGETLQEGENPFTDTDNSYVIKGYNAGILSGYGNGLYGPSDLITREQLAILLIKTLRAANIDCDICMSTNIFTDDDQISNWAREYVYLASYNGILNGVGNNMLAPQDHATREQSIIMAKRILDQYASSDVSDIGSVLEVHYIDVGQGDSTLIKYEDYAILIDAGNNEYGPVVVDYLKDQGIDDIDIMVATHNHADHIGGLDDVLKAVDVKTIIKSGGEADTRTFEDFISCCIDESTNYGCEIIDDENMTFDIDENIKFEIIEMGDGYSNENDNSVVSVLSYNDIDFLFTGDLESDVEKANISLFPMDIEVYQVGHHGSNTASSVEMLNKTTPELAIISAGIDNKYGHPHAETLSKFKTLGIETYCTKCGSLMVSTDGETYSIGEGAVALNPDDFAQTGGLETEDLTPEPVSAISDVSIISVDPVSEIVTIKNNGNTNINMNGWKLVSVLGNQTYCFPSGFSLGAGETVKVTSGRNAFEDGVSTLLWCKSYIWNNDESDPAKLYNVGGALISEK